MPDWQKVGTALSGFGAGLQGQGPQWQMARVAEQKRAEEARIQQDAERQRQMLQDMYMVQQSLANNDVQSAQYHLSQRIERLAANGEDTSGTQRILQLTQADPNRALNEVSSSIKFFTDMGGAGRAASVKSYAPIQRQDGTWGIPTFDPTTQEVGFVDMPGLDTETPAERAQREASVEVDTTYRKNAADRASAMISEVSQQAMTASANEPLIREALLFSDYATQGLPGRVKMAFATLVPDIDVSDEAGLQQAQTQLSLNQLQMFKGPTTDYEMGVVQEQVGRLGDPRSANQARLKALQRNTWFIKEKMRQMKAWQKAGEDMDYFAFDFNKPVTVAGKPLKLKDGSTVTLMDIQQTAVENHLSIEETIKRLRGL